MQTALTPQNSNKNAGFVIEVEESQGLSLKDGAYTGTIDHIERRPVTLKDGTPAVYADFHVRPEGVDGTIKVGYSARITPRSDLGALLTVFGIPMPPAKTPVDLVAMFGGKKVAFLVRNETNDDGTFSRIVKGSLRPSA